MGEFNKSIDEQCTIRQMENNQATQNYFRRQNDYINNLAPFPDHGII